MNTATNIKTGKVHVRASAGRTACGRRVLPRWQRGSADWHGAAGPPDGVQRRTPGMSADEWLEVVARRTDRRTRCVECKAIHPPQGAAA